MKRSRDKRVNESKGDQGLTSISKPVFYKTIPCHACLWIITVTMNTNSKFESLFKFPTQKYETNCYRNIIVIKSTVMHEQNNSKSDLIVRKKSSGISLD